MASAIYPNAKVLMHDGGIDFDTDNIKVALVTADYTYSASHDFFDDITNECTGDGYVTGGASLASADVTLDGTAGMLDATDITWTTATITAARAAILYKNTGTPGTSALIAYIDFGAAKSSSGADFKITWDETGIIRWT